MRILRWEFEKELDDLKLLKEILMQEIESYYSKKQMNPQTDLV